MNRATLIFIFSLAFSAAFSQFKKPTDLRDFQYKNEASGGVRVQTNGFSIFGEYGWIKDIKRTRLLQLEYSYYIDYRQKKQNARITGGRDFVFGLQNRFHTIRAAYGFKRVIADKAPRNGVCVSVTFFGGVSLGLLKPYYLNLLQPTDGGVPVIKAERYSESNAVRFLSMDSIVEAAPIRVGLNQMQPVAGAHIKTALDFDWGSKDEFVKALQAGVMIDVYYKRLPIMINNNNRFFQASFFISFQFGKRW